MNIGIIGYGNVAKETVRLIEERTNFAIKYIVKSDGGIYLRNKEKVSNIKEIKLHKNWNSSLTYKDIVEDKSVNIILELTSTNIENGEPAITHIKEGIINNKHIITGNKGPIIHAYNELNKLASEYRVNLGIGCTVGGALPTFIVGSEGLNGSTILTIEGVLNGTSNYILDLMNNENLTFEDGLKKAQEQGIAEKDPKLDIEGYDTAIKIIILVNTILNKSIKLSDVSIKGIQDLTMEDIIRAKENNGVIKLIARYKHNTISVSPEIITQDNILYSVNGKNKGIKFETDLLGEIFIAGGESSVIGAAASILRDILNVINLSNCKQSKIIDKNPIKDKKIIVKDCDVL
ncbi:MAG: homoserine dehydrogenase [Clostridium sp.]